MSGVRCEETAGSDCFKLGQIFYIQLPQTSRVRALAITKSSRLSERQHRLNIVEPVAMFFDKIDSIAGRE